MATREEAGQALLTWACGRYIGIGTDEIMLTVRVDLLRLKEIDGENWEAVLSLARGRLEPSVVVFRMDQRHALGEKRITILSVDGEDAQPYAAVQGWSVLAMEKTSPSSAS